MPVASWFDDMSDTELRDLIPFFTDLSTCDNVYKKLRQTNNSTKNSALPQEKYYSLNQIMSDNMNASSPIASVPQVHKEEKVLIG